MRMEIDSVRYYSMKRSGLGYFVLLMSFFLVTTCLATPEIEELDVRSLRRALGKATDPLVRQRICELLGLHGNTDMKVAISALMKATKDDNAEVRREAVLQLGKLAQIGNKHSMGLRVGPDRVKWSTSGRRTEPRIKHITSLITFDEDIVKRLIECLKKDKVMKVREMAVYALSGLTERILDYLEDLPAQWRRPNGFSVKQMSEATKTYEEKARESVSDNLDLVEKIFSGYKMSLKKEKKLVVRRQVVVGLISLIYKLSDIKSSDSICNEDEHRLSIREMRDDIFSILAKLLKKEEEIIILREIVPVLVDFDGRKVKRAIIEILKDSKDPELRRIAVAALEKLGGKSAEEALINAMVDSRTDDKLREEIIVALAGLRAKSSVHELIVIAVGKGNLSLRKMAVAALGQIGDVTALPAVIGICKDSDVSLRLAAVSALSSLGGEKAMEGLILRLRKDEDSSVRIRVVELLAEMGGKRAVSALTGTLGDRDASVRKSVLKTIGEISDQNSLVDVIKVLRDDKDCHVRAEAATVARLLGDKRAVPALINALHDESKFVRIRAAEELGEIKDGRACGELFLIWRTDESSEVQATARKAIQKIKPYCRGEYERLRRGIKRQE